MKRFDPWLAIAVVSYASVWPVFFLILMTTYGEVAPGHLTGVEDDARARAPESARSSHGAAEHAPSAGQGDPPSSPTNSEFVTGKEEAK